jgi:hypothetical protein
LIKVTVAVPGRGPDQERCVMVAETPPDFRAPSGQQNDEATKRTSAMIISDSDKRLRLGSRIACEVAPVSWTSERLRSRSP